MRSRRSDDIEGWLLGHAAFVVPNRVESWAGGLTGALSLLLIYGLISRRGRPARSPVVWACGLGVTLPIGIQLVIAGLEGAADMGLEGTADMGDDYTNTIAAQPGIFVPILLLSALVGPAVHTLWWTRRRG